MDKVRVGVIGAGAISGQYLGKGKIFPFMEMTAIADLNVEAAAKRAAEFGVPKVCTVDELLADPAIDIVLNLTIPRAHVPVALRAIEAGKHTFAEKPLGIDREEGKKLIAAGAAKKLRVGCAPDTFLGSGIQTARKAINDGLIGRPVGFTATMIGRGHEHWHPSPEFYYDVGGGPMFDMGPYYLTALLNLLGPVKRVMGMASVSQPERTIVHKTGTGERGPKYGQKMPVKTPDHVLGLMEFSNGCVGSIMQSFAMRAGHGGPSPIVIYGTEGTLRVPDPNNFDGPTTLCRFEEDKADDFVELPVPFVTGYGRSVGLADMASAIANNRPHRCSGEQAMAVLDLMQAFLDSSAGGRTIEPSVPYTRPAAMRPDLPVGQLDD